jgi:hypothetical protein
MKSITCDFCKKSVELDKMQAVPYGWIKYKMDSRVAGNIGGQVMRLDCCVECGQTFKASYLNKEKTVRIFKEALSETV